MCLCSIEDNYEYDYQYLDFHLERLNVVVNNDDSDDGSGVGDLADDDHFSMTQLLNLLKISNIFFF